MKYQNLFSRENKKKYFKMSSAEIFTQHAVLSRALCSGLLNLSTNKFCISYSILIMQRVFTIYDCNNTKYWDRHTKRNSVDTDQTPQNAASRQDSTVCHSSSNISDT